jgi:tetratricopeptide (TPR) repeat protein
VVPATLHDSLMARLDRLGPAKDIAQVAAVIGHQFSRELLAGVVSCSAEELSAGLLRLVEAGLVYHSSRPGDTTYSFKHALLRDLAYENLLRARRRTLHERIGRVLVERFASVAEAEPEVLAYHFQQAHLLELAIAYRERAGDRAVARSSFVEAIAHFNDALSEAAQLTQGPDRMRRELDLLLKLSPALWPIKGAQSAEMADACARAQQHAVALGDETGAFKATWGLWFHANTGRRLDLARDRAEELVTLARNSGNDDFLLEGFHCLWSTAHFRGDVTKSLEASREGIQRYDLARHSWLGPVFGGHDPGVCALSVRLIALSLRGQYAESKRIAEEMLSLAEELKHPYSQAHALMNVAVGAQISCDYRAADAHAQRLLAIADRYNFPPVRAHASFISGWARASVNDLDAGMRHMEAEFPRASAVGPYFRYYAALLAEGREKSNRFSEALALLSTTLESVTEPGVGFYISELYRVQGLCLLRAGESPNEEAAIQSLRMAVNVAREQGATLLELRATVSLARAELAIGRAAECLNSLRELCTTLPPEFDAAADVADANDLLAAVRA